ncbi:hypothetical protein CRUP_003615 [Coryphaenoides rupestris]|nr:hypothetical protein CRUP_003615 [Coryphaenoides rupestris]
MERARQHRSSAQEAEHQGGGKTCRGPHSLVFCTTGMGSTWWIFTLSSPTSARTQSGRKGPLKPTSTSLSPGDVGAQLCRDTLQDGVPEALALHQPAIVSVHHGQHHPVL